MFQISIAPCVVAAVATTLQLWHATAPMVWPSLVSVVSKIAGVCPHSGHLFSGPRLSTIILVQYGPPNELYDLWYYCISESSQSVHPSGYPISHSTHTGFSFPPATALSGSEFRLNCDGPALLSASWVVGVGNMFS